MGFDMSPKEIGKLVRKYRKSQKLLKKDVGGLTGVGERFIIELESGKSTIQLGKALKVIKMLGCQIEIKPPRPRN